MASHHCAIVLGYTSLNDSPWIHINEWQSMASHHCTTVLGYTSTVHSFTSLSDSPRLHTTTVQQSLWLHITDHGFTHHCATVRGYTSLSDSPWIHIMKWQPMALHHWVTVHGFTSLNNCPRNWPSHTVSKNMKQAPFTWFMAWTHSELSKPLGYWVPFIYQSVNLDTVKSGLPGRGQTAADCRSLIKVYFLIVYKYTGF